MSKASTIGSAKSSMKRKNSIWHALPYIAPHFIIFAVFGIIPIVFGIGLAFTRWNMVGAPKFVGLQNFAKIFDPSTYFYSIFWRDLGHTLLFVLVSVPLTIIVPLLLAVALSKKGLKGAGLFQAIFYIPGLISIAAGALVWRMVFNSQFGLLNTTFHSDINWLGKNPYAWITIFVLVLWAGIGGNLVIYRSALSGVDESLYEAAKVDGAGSGQDLLLHHPAGNQAAVVLHHHHDHHGRLQRVGPAGHADQRRTELPDPGAADGYQEPRVPRRPCGRRHGFRNGIAAGHHPDGHRRDPADLHE